MVRRPTAALLVLLPALALALAACGGGKSDEDAIRDTIRGSLMTTDPDDCAPGTSQSAAFVRQNTFGSASLQRLYERRCRADVKRLAAKHVTVSGVKVSGSTAEATFKADGGQYAYTQATVAMRKNDDRWQIDRLKSLKLDRAAYDRQQAQFATGGEALSSSDAACFSRRLSKVSDARLEAAIVASKPGVFADGFLICFVRPELRTAGFSLSQTRCIVVRLRRTPEALMHDVFAGTSATERKLKRDVTRAARTCARR